MELDVVSYDPRVKEILHIEPSLDADARAERERRFVKKFEAGRRYILKEIFPWVPPETPIRQRAVFVSAAEHRRKLAGADVRSVDEVVAEIRQAVTCQGMASRGGIPEQFPLLRTVQLVVCGYYRVVGDTPSEPAHDLPA